MDMQIDQLIRDLILEDQFKEKYTKRQRSIFCNNMYEKIATFMKVHQDELRESEKKVQKYRNAYIELAKSYADLRKKPPVYLWMSLMYGYLFWFIMMAYILYS
jgi:hypothetical protein